MEFESFKCQNWKIFSQKQFAICPKNLKFNPNKNVLENVSKYDFKLFQTRIIYTKLIQ